MEYLYRDFNQDEYSDFEFLVDQEIELILDIVLSIIGRDIEDGDEKRITLIKASNYAGCSFVFWDGVRRGFMYSGFDPSRKSADSEPRLWMIFYVPDETCEHWGDQDARKT